MASVFFAKKKHCQKFADLVSNSLKTSNRFQEETQKNWEIRKSVVLTFPDHLDFLFFLFFCLSWCGCTTNLIETKLESKETNDNF